MEQSNIAYHSDSDKINGSRTWSTMAGVARPLCVVFLRGDESEVESNDGYGEATACCVIAVATASSLQEVRIRWYHSVRWS